MHIENFRKELTYNTVKNLYRSSIDSNNTALLEKIKESFPEFINEKITLDKPVPFLLLSDDIEAIKTLQQSVVESVAKTLDLNVVVKTDFTQYLAQPNDLVFFKPDLGNEAENTHTYYTQQDNFMNLQQVMNNLGSLNKTAAGVIVEFNDTGNFSPITQNFLLDFIRNEKSYSFNSNPDSSSEHSSLKNITILANAKDIDSGPFSNSFHVVQVEAKEVVLDRISSLRNEHTNNKSLDSKLKNN